MQSYHEQVVLPGKFFNDSSYSFFTHPKRRVFYPRISQTDMNPPATKIKETLMTHHNSTLPLSNPLPKSNESLLSKLIPKLSSLPPSAATLRRRRTSTRPRRTIVQKPTPILINIHGHILPREVVRRQRIAIQRIVVDVCACRCLSRGRCVQCTAPVVEAFVADEGVGCEVEAGRGGVWVCRGGGCERVGGVGEGVAGCGCFGGGG